VKSNTFKFQAFHSMFGQGDARYFHHNEFYARHFHSLERAKQIRCFGSRSNARVFLAVYHGSESANQPSAYACCSSRLVNHTGCCTFAVCTRNPNQGHTGSRIPVDQFAHIAQMGPWITHLQYRNVKRRRGFGKQPGSRGVGQYRRGPPELLLLG